MHNEQAFQLINQCKSIYSIYQPKIEEFETEAEY